MCDNICDETDTHAANKINNQQEEANQREKLYVQLAVVIGVVCVVCDHELTLCALGLLIVLPIKAIIIISIIIMNPKIEMKTK